MSRKGENIYKRKDGRWEARYLKKDALDGRPHYGYCYGKTYSEAKEKVTKASPNWGGSWQKLLQKSRLKGSATNCSTERNLLPKQ